MRYRTSGMAQQATTEQTTTQRKGSRAQVVVAARSVAVARGGQVVLEISRLDIEAGVTSIIGPNGSGKSTLLHAIVGLLPVERGRLAVLGGSPQAARKRIAYVLQAQTAPAHLPVTVHEVVALGRAPHRGAFRPLTADDRAAIDSAIERVELTVLARRHLTELSGGERQRVFVAQGLAQDADLLLLDEPLAGLDLASSNRIRRVMQEEAAAGRAVVMATHDLSDAAASDDVVLLAGEVVAAGRPDAVLTRDHIRAAYGERLLHLDGELVMIDDGAHHEASRPAL
jgi:ABC-type Mn2+/Zn2+ transport system ATPase subunit